MEDIKLEPLQQEDLEMIRNWRNSKFVSDYMYTDQHISEEDQLKWFAKIGNDESCEYWLITFKDKKLGVAGIHDISPVLDSCYWTMYLGDTSLRGAGIGKKVEFNILQYVLETRGLNKLRCEVFESNDKVIKMHEKFGFRREAYYREHIEKQGEKINVVGLGILKSEWLRLKPNLFSSIYEK